MKKTVYILLLFVQFSWAQNAFETANNLYQKEKFTDAANAYESIITSGKESAEVYFNLGNCYYKLHKVKVQFKDIFQSPQLLVTKLKRLENQASKQDTYLLICEKILKSHSKTSSILSVTAPIGQHQLPHIFHGMPQPHSAKQLLQPA